MTTSHIRPPGRGLHPVHALLLGGAFPLFLGGLLSDLAYSSSYHIQWSNFASWLIVGGLVFSGLALLWAAIELVRADRRGTTFFVFTLLLLATWLVGFFNSLTHAKDAWAAMPMGLVLSVIAVLLACAATWVGFAKFGVGGAR
ncbi:DUF2231 domain-containing protein [Massilia sp. PAMC28688]|uniref:DUF2231 domain-containing protein n=1 Tax=Massilia sp. PAMC28688 TaxID=2861283 RepID=UPI001E57A256|nr:DUF2231 domain-containing protein [Massilia sp. PAMC28688]